MADESRNWQWNQSRDHGPDRPNKEQRENQTNKPVENSREVLTDIPETRNLGSMVMKCLETKRTNRSSGSLDEAQEHSIEIDFGDGKTASRKSSLTEAQALHPSKNAETTSLPKELAKPDVLNQERQSALLAQATDKPAAPPELTKPNELSEAHAALAGQRQTLEELANKTMKNPQERSQFATDMQNFERNFTNRSQKTEIEKAQEMAATYSQACRLLYTTDDVLSRYPTQCRQKPDESPWRTKAAQEIIHKAAEPFSINQGRLAICPTAALQVRQYYRDPSAPARLVTDVILTGQYTSATKDKHINLTDAPVNLIPNSDARHYKISDENCQFTDSHGQKVTSNLRSYASQIFDVTATNLILSDRGYRYEQAQDDMKKAYQDSENQGQVINPKDRKITRWKTAIESGLCVCDADFSKLNEYITGKYEPGFVITGASLPEDKAQDLQSRKIFDFQNRESGVTYLFRASELSECLKSIDRNDQWPPIALVNSALPPINQSGGNKHFIVISSYSNEGKVLAIDNTWGNYRDANSKPLIPASDIAISIRSLTQADGSWWNKNKNLIEYKKEHQGEWQSLIAKWISLPDKLSRTSTSQDRNKLLYLNRDPILEQWLSTHPNDHNLKLWKHSLDYWLDKYPEERPKKTK